MSELCDPPLKGAMCVNTITQLMAIAVLFLFRCNSGSRTRGSRKPDRFGLGQSSRDVWIRNQDSTYFLVSKDDNNITQAILASALVMAYYRNDGRPNVVFSLPSSNELLTLGYFMQVRENKGSMNFDLTFYERRLIPIDFDLEFRWIIVPPKARGCMKSIDFTNYQQVKEEFGLSD